MSYSIESSQSDCYPNTNILKNKFNIKDQEKLDEVELVIVLARSTEWEAAPKSSSFDFNHYKEIHKYLFSEIYDWAGNLRTVDISKKGTKFCSAKDIDFLGNKIFSRLKEMNCFKGLSKDEFIDELTDFYCSTNMLHPFREGNGRTQRLFITQLVKNAGYSINFSNIDTDELMIATIQSANGVTDNLKNIFESNII